VKLRLLLLGPWRGRDRTRSTSADRRRKEVGSSSNGSTDSRREGTLLREWTGELTNSRTDRSAKAGIESVSTRLHSTPGLTGITKVSRRLKRIG
jgi:hypothetical protein